MSRYRRLSLDQRRELARRHRRGERAEALAAAFGVSVRSAHRIAAGQRGETARARDPAGAVSFRVPASEVEAFEALAAEAGLGRRGPALRALLRMASGLIEPRGDGIGRLHEAAVVASRLGINLNQLARAVHTGKLRLGDEDRALLVTLAREVEALRRAWSAVQEAAAARRGFARRGLEAAAGPSGGEEEPAGG